jgi:lysyl-tRNA synthetase class 1
MSDTVRNSPLAAPKSWPFEEAAKVARRLAASGKGEALFETGYGPSGLPHIGTFAEVARTTWVRHAYGVLTGRPSRLLAFSDDMDGLRKVPDNVPNQEALRAHIGKPLTRVPDPFGTHDSFGAHNNSRLRAFLDGFGFEYEFASSTQYYTEGRFDAALLRVLALHDEIVAVIRPTLGAERQATYSPFLPVHPRTGVVLQVNIEKTDAAAGTIAWRDPEDGAWFETKVTGGAAKLQWKADWAMRWHALGVDYEMSGKDLIDSVKLSGRICRILGSEPPAGFTYELFLDETGQKISKSKGNGLSVEEWLRYAPPESLSQFMFNQPQRARRLYFDAIPKAVDEYLANAEKARVQQPPDVFSNPAWHIHGGRIPNAAHSPLSFAMLLNLASVVNADSPDMLWGFIRRYDPHATPEAMPFLDSLVRYALAYCRDFVAPKKAFREPDANERATLADLADVLAALPVEAPAEDIQNHIYEVGKRHPFAELRAWFGCLYQVLLGQQEGPRFGQFVALYGIAESVALIRAALAREPADRARTPDAA